jgi:predicted transcriptional regulator
MTTTHALISLEQRFADGILRSTKRVELRRRPMRLEVGTTIWMYVKVPVGKVVGSAQVYSTHELAPSTLWRRYGDVSGLARGEFYDYFSGLSKGFVVVLTNPTRLSEPVSLDQLRKLNGAFQPPQFFQHLANDGPFVSAFTRKASDHQAPRARAHQELQFQSLCAA